MLEATLFTAGACGLLYLVLSYRVSQTRLAEKISLGDAGNERLTARIRAHANFAEYVPVLLILMAAVELMLGGEGTTALWVLGIVLLLSRIAHAMGIARPAPNKLRAFGIVGTWLCLAILSIWALVLSGLSLGSGT